MWVGRWAFCPFPLKMEEKKSSKHETAVGKEKNTTKKTKAPKTGSKRKKTTAITKTRVSQIEKKKVKNKASKKK